MGIQHWQSIIIARGSKHKPRLSRTTHQGSGRQTINGSHRVLGWLASATTNVSPGVVYFVGIDTEEPCGTLRWPWGLSSSMEAVGMWVHCKGARQFGASERCQRQDNSFYKDKSSYTN
jgi:hypothetical protein